MGASQTVAPAGSGSGARLLTAVIPVAVSSGAIGWALATQRWSEWGIEAMPAMTPATTSFADLANITMTAQCVTDGTDYTVCDPYGRPFQPYVVLPARILAALGLGPSATGPLGIGLAVALVAVIAVLALVLARRWEAGVMPLVAAQALLAVMAVTAPVMLAVERGQIEILTLGFTVAALLLLAREHWLPRTLGAISGVIAVVTKYFSLGLFLPFIRRGRPQWAAIAGIVASLAFLLVARDDVAAASGAAAAGVPVTAKSQFGATTLIATLFSAEPLRYDPDAAVVDAWTTVRIVGVALFVLAVGASALLVRAPSVRALTERLDAFALIVGGAGALALPYVLGSSHDYRLMLCLPVLVGALVLVSTRRSPIVAWTLVVTVCVSLTTGSAMVPTPDGFIWGKAAMVVGDVALLVALALPLGIWVRSWFIRRG